ncbi:hypothetical protein [Nostoc sp.]|uniref:hypothetical protein n=1 Tax=Nostoc sp. TaxID=1180 RepID=UPI002FF906F8
MSNKQQTVTSLGLVFEVFCKAIALFLRFSARRSLILGQQAIALFLRFSARRSHSLLDNRRSLYF